MNIESKNYVATESDVAKLTEQYLNAIAAQGSGKLTYLRALFATAQSLYDGDTPVKRSPALEVIAAQVKILEDVHRRFYAVVMRVISESEIDDDAPGSKNIRRHRRGVFARTSFSMLRTWLKDGNDIRSRKPEQVTKRSLAVKRPERKAREVSVERQALTHAERIAELAAGANKTNAVQAIEAAMARLTQALMDLGERATTRADLSVTSGRPFKTRDGLFWPVTQPQAAPS